MSRAQLGGAQRTMYAIAAVGFLLLVVGYLVAPAQLFRSYWLAWIVFVALAFGSFGLVALQRLTGGRWSRLLQSPAQAATRTLPLLLLLACPAAFGLKYVFTWAQPGFFAAHPLWPHHRAWLQQPWFWVRLIACFILLTGMARLLRAEKKPTQFTAGMGALLYALTMNFASTDWIMSLEPAWYSTIFTVIVVTNQLLSALALCVIVVLFRSPSDIEFRTLRDLGNLLLALVLFWAYVSFSQFLIIWNGNLPREIEWYVHRRAGGWPTVALALGLLQFLLPFALLLSRDVKHRPNRLLGIASIVLGASVLSWYWLIVPAFAPLGVSVHWLDFVAMAAVGSVWTAGFVRNLTIVEVGYV